MVGPPSSLRFDCSSPETAALFFAREGIGGEPKLDFGGWNGFGSEVRCRDGVRTFAEAL